MSSPAPAASPPAPAGNSTASPPAPVATPPVASPPPPSSSSPPPPDTTSPPPPGTSPPPPAPVIPPSGSTTPPPPAKPTPSTPPPPSSNQSPPPPPPPASSKVTPPSPKSGSNSPPPPPNSSTASLSSTAVIGIAIGGVVIVLLLGLVCFFCMKKKKRRREDYGGEQYYGHRPHPQPPPPRVAAPAPKDDYNGGGQGQHWQQNNPTPPDQYMMPPRPPGGGKPPLNRPSTPPHQLAHSSGSGSNYGSDGQLPPPSPGMGMGFSKNTFTYEELAAATDGFADANILGQGGFGYVHKGVLPNGKEVAVKALKVGSGQGEREFQAEVEIISRVHHRHLVSLVGYCMAGSQRMLVYEFVPNNTMEFHLHGKGRPTMDWPTRLKIALGSAKGLAYLHEDCHPKIIHRDIKASNILIDSKFEAKVADFGLAKFSPELDTHISTRVMGTFGYLAPEYASSGRVTDKSDVFSYGVMLLELITGRRPVDSTQTYTDDSLVDWARPLLSRALDDDNFDSLVDQRLQKSFNQNEMARMVACAAACVRHSARRRPRMSQVVRALEGDVSLSDLNEGTRPGQSMLHDLHGSSDYDSSQYKEDMKKFRQTAFASQEQGGSSEYGGTTSEYGLYPSGSSSEAQSRQTTREMGTIKRDSQGFSGTGSSGTGEFDPEQSKKKAS